MTKINKLKKLSSGSVQRISWSPPSAAMPSNEQVESAGSDEDPFFAEMKELLPEETTPRSRVLALATSPTTPATSPTTTRTTSPTPCRLHYPLHVMMDVPKSFLKALSTTWCRRTEKSDGRQGRPSETARLLLGWLSC